MELITRLWKNFKVQPEIWFFFGFLLTFTLTVRKVLFFFPLRGGFNEYSGIYLYLSDIFLGLTLLAWVIIILYNKIDILSMLKNVPSQKECSTPQKLFHVEQLFAPGQAWNILWDRRGTLLIPLALVVWSFVSLIWSENKIVSIFRSIKILEFYLLYIFVLVRLFYWDANKIVPRETLLRKVFGLVMFIGLFQAIIGIIQLLLQHSIGLFWLKESLISPSIAGVAKIIFNGEPFIRAYGLFPHPNILGGFLMFSIFVSVLYYKMFHSNNNVPPPKQENFSNPLEMFHPARIVPRGTINGAGVELSMGQAWNFLRGKRGIIISKLILGIQLLALILTFSKSAILGLFLGLVYYAYNNVPSQNGCSTWNILQDRRGTNIDFFRKKKRLTITTVLIIIFAFVIAKPDLHSFFIKSLNDRSVYINVSRGTIWDNPILGIGNDQFVISMENLPIIKENWMLEPVHNVFLLIWSELGLIGFLLLVWLIFLVLKNVPRPPRLAETACRREAGGTLELAKIFSAVFIGFLFIMFFDHYLWDIQQGGFLLWMTMGFLVGAGECKNTI